MTPKLLYRIAAVLLIFFAAGHTYGFLKFKPPSPAALAVRDAMATPFQVAGSTFSYQGFYVGFGLFVTVYLLFSAYLAWHLSWLATAAPASIGFLGWIFAAVQAASFVLSCIYFSIPPATFSGILTICLVWAALTIGDSQTPAAKPLQ